MLKGSYVEWVIIKICCREIRGFKLEDDLYECCLSAFGGGLSWGALVMQLGNMDFCEMIESNL